MRECEECGQPIVPRSRRALWRYGKQFEAARVIARRALVRELEAQRTVYRIEHLAQRAVTREVNEKLEQTRRVAELIRQAQATE